MPSANVPAKLVVVDWLTVSVLVPAVALLSVIVPAVPLKLATLIELELRSRTPPDMVIPPVPRAVALPSVSVPAPIVVPPE